MDVLCWILYVSKTLKINLSILERFGDEPTGGTNGFPYKIK